MVSQDAEPRLEYDDEVKPPPIAYMCNIITIYA